MAKPAAGQAGKGAVKKVHPRIIQALKDREKALEGRLARVPTFAKETQPGAKEVIESRLADVRQQLKKMEAQSND